MVIGGCTAGPRLFYTSRLGAARPPTKRYRPLDTWRCWDLPAGILCAPCSAPRRSYPLDYPTTEARTLLPSFLARRCTNWYHYAKSKYVCRLCVYRSGAIWMMGYLISMARNSRKTIAPWLPYSFDLLLCQLSLFARFWKLDWLIFAVVGKLSLSMRIIYVFLLKD